MIWSIGFIASKCFHINELHSSGMRRFEIPFSVIMISLLLWMFHWNCFNLLFHFVFCATTLLGSLPHNIRECLFLISTSSFISSNLVWSFNSWLFHVSRVKPIKSAACDKTMPNIQKFSCENVLINAASYSIFVFFWAIFLFRQLTIFSCYTWNLFKH